MRQFAEFVVNHWVLFALLLVILILLAWNLIAAVAQGGLRIGPSEVTRLINHENAMIIDLRDRAEYSQGHILNAINVPLAEFAERMKELEKFRDRPIVICCQADTIPGRAAASLTKSGFERLYRLKGGILAWRNASLPLTKE